MNDVLEIEVAHPSELLDGIMVEDATDNKRCDSDSGDTDTNNKLVELELLKRETKMRMKNACNSDTGSHIEQVWRVERQRQAQDEANSEYWRGFVITYEFGTHPEQQSEPEDDHNNWSTGAGKIQECRGQQNEN